MTKHMTDIRDISFQFIKLNVSEFITKFLYQYFCPTSYKIAESQRFEIYNMASVQY